jgi:hypothetical protein
MFLCSDFSSMLVMVDKGPLGTEHTFQFVKLKVEFDCLSLVFQYFTS